jgi:hypothetical protein
MGPIAGLNTVLEIERRSLGLRAVVHSLYGLSYPRAQKNIFPTPGIDPRLFSYKASVLTLS